ncbi:MAG TPA: hypothetical protein VN458_06230 [Solirubrobacterales bacterium]|nr:hypothetical protein [Solirubrobacterales bacterium]
MRSTAVGGALVVTLLFASVGSAAGSFAGDGFETVDFGGADKAQGVAIRSGGTIVVAGSTRTGPSASDFAVARFKRSGSLDDSFSENGMKTTDFGGRDEAYDVAIQPNGRIVVVGTSTGGGRRTFALARYRKGGALDDSFSSNGKARTSFGVVAKGVAIQANGRIVVVGRTRDEFAVVRYKRNGHLDDSFSGNGKTRTDFGDYDSAHDVAIQRSGRIVVGGQGSRHDDFALARYKRNGRLDRSFSSDGKRTVRFSGHEAAEGVAIQENGRLVAAGSTHPSAPGDSFAVARLKKEGGLDRSFGGEFSWLGDGKTITGFRDDAAAHNLAIQRNGRIVVVGESGIKHTWNTFFHFEFSLARYKRNGHLDHSFSGNGKQTTAFGPGDEVAYDVAFQSRRKLIVAGVISAGDLTDPAQDFLIARYRNNGDLDH